MKTANKHTISDLKQMQSLPLDAKIKMTQRRIQEWVDEFGEDGVYVSFSGGKDSTVLLDIARKLYPDIEAIYINTGLEYPSVRQFALSKENVTEIRPNMNFRDVIIKYGYPIISKEVSQTLWEAQKSVRDGRNTYTYRLKKLNGEAVDKEGNPSQYNIPQWKFLLNAPFNISHKCCDVMKKNPAKKYENDNEIVGIIATMADESRLRQEKWLKNGCNAFELKRPQSNPMSFWTEQDVLTYIHTYIHTGFPLQAHMVKWYVIGIKMDLQKVKLIYLKNMRKLFQDTNCQNKLIKQQGARGLDAFSAGLE